jgi:hypothetical protein
MSAQGRQYPYLATYVDELGHICYKRELGGQHN